MASYAMDMDSYLTSIDSKKNVFKKANLNSVFTATTTIGSLIKTNILGLAAPTKAPAKAPTKAPTKAPDDGAVQIFNSDAESFVNSLESGSVSSGKLDTVQNTAVGLTGQSFSIVRTVALILILIAAIIALIKIAMSNSQGKNEGKTGLVWALFAVVALAALGSFVGLAFEVGTNLFG